MILRNLLLEYLTRQSDAQFDVVLFGLERFYPKLCSQVSFQGSARSQQAIQLIRFVGQDPEGLHRLCKELGEPFTVPGTAIVKLEELLQQAAIPEAIARKVFNAYLRTLGEHAGWELPKWNNWDDLFAYLLDPSWMKGSGQNHLLHFITRLAPHVNPMDRRRALQSWVRNTASALGIDPPRLSARRESESQPQDYLLLALSPEGNYYTLHAWFMSNPGEYDRIYGEKLGFTLDDMPKHLKAILAHSKVTGACLAGNPPVVEFFLPVKLLNRDLDEWTPPGDRKPLGAKYCLVVRAWERFREIRWREDWGRYWKELRDTLGKRVVSRHRMAWLACPEDRYCGAHLRSGRWVFGLCFVPDNQCFEVLLESGVAILLWPRREVEHIMQPQFKELIARQLIRDLPEWLRQRREEHWEKSQKAGPLSLLWDDPGRLPDDYRPLESHPDFL